MPEGWRLDVERLPSGLGRCIWSQRRIVLDSRLTPAQRRCTLAHEILHARRGPFPNWRLAREEAIISATVARMLIPMPALLDAVAWSRQPVELAEVLGVDLDTLRLRISSLASSEQAQLATALDSCGPELMCA